ncbi:MAG: hypothetical protein RH942_13300 [Kiloniellaceae bacterium]
MRYDDFVSPYLKRPLRSLEEVLHQRQSRPLRPRRIDEAPAADNNNFTLALPLEKSA